MKHFLIVLFFLSGMAAMSQVTVVVNPADTLVCFRDSVPFTSIVTGAGNGNLTYQWQKNFIDISGATDSVYAISHVALNDPGLYRCIVAVNGIVSDTSNDALLRMHPKMNIDTLYRYNALGCVYDCKGQFKVQMSGGTPPYEYYWGGGKSQDTIVYGLCRGFYTFTAKDSMGCSLDSIYFVDVLKSPKVTFSIEPDTVVYLTNPNIRVAFPDSMNRHITNWTWNFGDSVKVANLNPATHTYQDTIKPGQIPITLTFTDLNGCDTTITNFITMKVAELDIPNLFTPNGDYINDKFAIELMDDKKKDFREAYLQNELLVFDRWGKKVYNATNYKSEDWDGERLSDGTYFYILRLTGQYRDEVLKGSVTILRGK